MPEHANNQTQNDPDGWFLRADDGSIYGPADTETLQAWCRDGRIEPGHEISLDQENWLPAESVAELEMDWYACLGDGARLGPFHLDLIPNLIQDGIIPGDATLEHRLSGESRPASPTGKDAVAAPVEADESADITPPEAPPPLPGTANDRGHGTQDTRQALQQLRAEHTVLKDDTRRLQEELSTAQSACRESEQRLLDQQDRTASAETEVENLNAQLGQIKDHYDRLQIENQSQFEQLDALRADLLEKEQRFKHELAEWQRRNDAKTELLAGTVQTLMQDDDLARHLETAPAAAVVDTGHDTEVLQSALQRLETQLEGERERARQHIEQLTRRQRRSPLAFAAIVLPAALILLLAVLLLSRLGGCQPSSGRRPAPGRPSAMAPAESSIPPSLPAVDSMDLTPDTSLLPEPSGVQAEPSAAATPDWPAITLPRASVTRTARTLRIVFHNGLFSAATRLTPDAEEDLVTLAGQLRGQLNGHQLMIVGHTDATPVLAGASRYVDNFALGMARAEAVKQFLAVNGGLPSASMRTASAGDASPPFPNDTDAGRQRNRTAILTLLAR